MPAAGVHRYKTDDEDVTVRDSAGSIRFLLGAACIVIISAGIKAASDVLSLVLLGLLLAYSALPIVRWMMHRFHLRKTMALALAVGVMGTLQLVLVVLLYLSAASMKQKFPTYQEHARGLYQQVTAFLHTHGIEVASSSATNPSNSSEIVQFAQMILPGASRVFSDGLVVVLLGGILLAMMADDTQRTKPRSILSQVQSDVAHYIDVLAMTGVLTAVANLVLLVAIGVDFPLVCCVLYFFFNFIPSIGFFLTLAAPSCLALLMLGWKRTLLVIGGLVLTQLVSLYAITPMFLKKKGVSISSMEKMLSLLWWGFLLGPAGGILAIPLTLAMKRFIPDVFVFEKSSAALPSG